LKSKKVIEIAKRKREKIKIDGERTSLLVVNKPKKITEEIKRIKNEILKFKTIMKKIEKKSKIKKKNFIIRFRVENKIKKMGKRQTKRSAREF
jgi:hypothetical protein